MRQRIPTVVLGTVVFILLHALPLLAQDDDQLSITPDEPLTIALDGENPILVTFTGTADETVTITLRSDDDTDDPLDDPILALRGPDDALLAYNNNHGSDDESLRPVDARISGFTLPVDGDYTIRADTYGSIFAGEYTLTLSFVDPFQTSIDESADTVTITGTLPRLMTYAYTFDAQSGERVTITARDLGRRLDPVLVLVDDTGAVLALNDDHGSDDFTLDAFDSRIHAFVVPQDGTYRLQLTDFLGMDGEFEVTITRQAGT